MNDFAMGYGGDEGTVAFLRKKLRKNLTNGMGNVGALREIIRERMRMRRPTRST